MNNQLCRLGVWDSSIPGISFDQNGVSNYAHLFKTLTDHYPRGESGKEKWEQIVNQIQKNKNKYNCIIGVSGGTDSSYLLYLAKKYNLRPLAVNLDNGWSSDIAVKNIKKITNALDIDLETYVIDYEEIKDLLRSYMLAGMPWIDLPTDLAIKAILYRIARRENISYILRGNDFRSEGTQPREWTYGDGKQLKYIHKKFGKLKKLKTFPNYTLSNLIYNGFIANIKSIYPYYYIDYNKQNAQEFLIKEYNWEYYGGHHHENIFTKFAISYWLYEKFQIDKRIISLSAQILSGAITREEALKQLSAKPYNSQTIEKEINYVLKKLDLEHDEFKKIMNSVNKSYLDYPSYYSLMSRFTKVANKTLLRILPHKPMAMFQMEMRKEKE